MRIIILALLLLTQQAVASDLSPHDLDLQIDLVLPNCPPTNWTNGITFNQFASGSLITQYAGLHDVFWSQVERRIKDYNSKRLQLMFDHTNITEVELKIEYDRINAPTDPYGQWWERHWWESQSQTNGGAPEPTIITVGSHWDIPNRFRLISSIKHHIERVWLDNDHTYKGLEDAGPTPNPITRQPNNTNPDPKELVRKKESVDVGLDPGVIESRGLFDSNNYKIRIRPSARFKSDYATMGPIDEVSFKTVIELFMGPRSLHFANITLYGRYDVPKKELIGSISLELVNW